MNTLETMYKRRSIREYEDEDISEEKLDKIIQAALLAPTSRNRNPCEFYVVKNREILNELSESKAAGSQFLKNANVGIVVLGDTEKADTWIEDSSIALTYMHLMAAGEDIGSCWIQIHMRKDVEGRDAEENVREILDVGENYRIVGIMALGVPAIQREGKTKEDLDYSKVKVID
ncbi:MAG: nitroreductase family protein [Methanobrevibacter sp.]|uniref:nitroreductase family protein n=1 Tax=Methanobrevibacter sp. TaxID=66852 RepID=UPI0026E04062|nr:nitroreductase family protein [Methanobrevibacter sp.]MDO5849441.1 nitroreductase family protein [Methanobrevibacter sp.]